MPLVLLTLTIFQKLHPEPDAERDPAASHEFQCDRYALRRTGMKDAFRSAFGKLARMNKSDPDPNPWVGVAVLRSPADPATAGGAAMMSRDWVEALRRDPPIRASFP